MRQEASQDRQIDQSVMELSEIGKDRVKLDRLAYIDQAKTQLKELKTSYKESLESSKQEIIAQYENLLSKQKSTMHSSNQLKEEMLRTKRTDVQNLYRSKLATKKEQLLEDS